MRFNNAEDEATQAPGRMDLAPLRAIFSTQKTRCCSGLSRAEKRKVRQRVVGRVRHLFGRGPRSAHRQSSPQASIHTHSHPNAVLAAQACLDNGYGQGAEEAVHNLRVNLRASIPRFCGDENHGGHVTGLGFAVEDGLNNRRHNLVEASNNHLRPTPSTVNWHDDRSAAEHEAVEQDAGSPVHDQDVVRRGVVNVLAIQCSKHAQATDNTAASRAVEEPQ